MCGEDIFTTNFMNIINLTLSLMCYNIASQKKEVNGIHDCMVLAR